MKLINLTEQEVARHFRGNRYWQIVGRPVFKKLKCLQDFQPNSNLPDKVFAKGEVYALWICDIKNISAGTFQHYVAVPGFSSGKDETFRRVIPTEIFGKQTDKRQKLLIEIPDAGKYRLILNYDGFFRLIPEWQLHKDEVEKAIRAADTAAHKEVQEYRLYPRIIGQTMRKAFVAYEINRRISNKITLQSFFNTVTGKEEKGSSFDIMISLVGNPKLSVIHGVTAKYNYPEKRIIMSFK